MTVEVEIIWPKVGSKWMDSKGRILRITRVQANDNLERHIIGIVRKRDYACSIRVFDSIWRDKPL